MNNILIPSYVYIKYCIPNALYVHNKMSERWLVSNDNEDPGLKCNDNGCLRKCLLNTNVNFAIGRGNIHNQHKVDTNRNMGAKKPKIISIITTINL